MYTELTSEISFATSHFPRCTLTKVSSYQFIALVDLLLAKEQELTLLLIFFDTDRFRLINNGLGYNVNEDLVGKIMQRVSQQLPANSYLVQFTSDKFGLVLNTSNEESTRRLVEQIRLVLLALPFQQAAHTLYLTANFGAASSYPNATAEQLLHSAELAMYEAKLAGANQVMIFKSGMDTRLKQRLLLESELRQAVERNEFDVYYQQVAFLKKNKSAALHYEALVRWQHPKRGMLSPGEFLPLAEEFDLISAIGWQVFKKTCQQLSKWQSLTKTRLQVSINICDSQFWQFDLVEKIQQILKETGVPASTVCLEITEKVIMHDIEAAKDILEQLKHLGLKTAIDDFGTGYSSLSALYQLPVDILKIDQSFVEDIQHDKKKFAIVKTIVNLAAILGQPVVAEGVTTKEQADILRKLGCKFGQGYYFARPVCAEAAFQIPTATRIPVAAISTNSTNSTNPTQKLFPTSWC